MYLRVWALLIKACSPVGNLQGALALTVSVLITSFSPM